MAGNRAITGLTESPTTTPTSSIEASGGSILVAERLGIWGWVLGYTAILSSLSMLRYHLWLATGWDLGFFEQSLWLLDHRGLLAVSTYTGKPVLADAAAYVLVFLAPLYAIGGVGLLLVLQAFAFGLGYLFIRKIGKALGVRERQSHLIGLTYLIYPTVVGANLYDFHPDSLGIPVLFGLIWAIIEDRWAVYILLLLASLLIKDTVPLLIIGTGITLLLRRRLAWGLATLLVGCLIGYLDVEVLIPRLGHTVMSQWSAYYGQLGASPLQGMLHLLTRPVDLISWNARLRAWEYLGVLFGPVAPIVVALRADALSPWWIPGVMLIEANLLSPVPLLTSPWNQMSVLAVPYFFVAILTGLRTHGRPPSGRAVTALWLILPLLFLAFFAWYQHRTNWRSIPPNMSALQAALAVIPRDAPVLVQNFVGPRLADRDQEWMIIAARTTNLPSGTYVILDPAVTTGLPPQTEKTDVARLQTALAIRGQATIVFSQDGVTVYRLLQPLPPSQQVDE